MQVVLPYTTWKDVSGFNSDEVSYLIDAYLADVVSDSNLKLTFSSLAAAIPGYARLTCDLLYSAIDIYFKVI
jgi:NPH3 family